MSSLREVFGGVAEPTPSPAQLNEIHLILKNSETRLIVEHARPLFSRSANPPATDDERRYLEIQRQGEERFIQHIVTNVLKPPQR